MASDEEIARAAIRADMEHRGFQLVGDAFVSTRTETTGSLPVERRITVSSTGTVHLDDSAYGGRPGDASTLEATLRAEVFDYWPQAITQVFRRWSGDLPDPLTFEVAVALGDIATRELYTGSGLPSDLDDTDVGNTRLAADLANLELRAGHLAGTYATTFVESYVTPLPLVLNHQAALLQVLVLAAAAGAQIWARVREDLRTLRTQALAAMHAASPVAGGSSVDVTLTVLGAAAAGVATFGTGAVAAVAGILETGTALAAAVTGGAAATEPTTRPLGAPDPHGVLTKLTTLLGDGPGSLSEDIEDEETLVQDALDQAVACAADQTPRRFRLPAPAITTAPTARILDAEQLIVVDASTIGRITALWIPCIVGDLHQARSATEWDDAAAWVRSAGIGLGAFGPLNAYRRLQDLLAVLISATAGDLEEAGAALAAAAADLGLADATQEQRYRTLADRITVRNRNHV